MSKFNIEVAGEGTSKWIRDVVSHTREQIRAAHENKEIITIVSEDGGETDVDMGKVFTIRFQDGDTFKKRSDEVMGRGR